MVLRVLPQARTTVWRGHAREVGSALAARPNLTCALPAATGGVYLTDCALVIAQSSAHAKLMRCIDRCVVNLRLICRLKAL
jgi:hypothetical protein